MNKDLNLYCFWFICSSIFYFKPGFLISRCCHENELLRYITYYIIYFQKKEGNNITFFKYFVSNIKLGDESVTKTDVAEIELIDRKKKRGTF